MKEEPSKIKSDILLRVRLLYVLFILAGAVVLGRLVWVQLFSHEVAYNARRLAGRIFSEVTVPAQRGSILTRDGDPLAASLFRYRVAFDFASPGLDSLDTYREQSDSLAGLLAAFFKDRSAAEYRRMFREEHARHYRLVKPRDTTYYRSEGRWARLKDRMHGEETVTRKIYDTIRDHTPVEIFPRDVDYAEWEVLRRYPLLNWNMGVVYRLIESDSRIYPQGELARRTSDRQQSPSRNRRKSLQNSSTTCMQQCTPPKASDSPRPRSAKASDLLSSTPHPWPTASRNAPDAR